MDSPSKKYYVVWELPVAAVSPHEAARAALNIQRNPNSGAGQFDVTEEGSAYAVHVNLDDPSYVAIQVIPIIQTVYGATPQFEGPDETTTDWAVYGRLANGEVEWLADVANEATAEIVGIALAKLHGVEIEHQPWKKK